MHDSILCATHALVRSPLTRLPYPAVLVKSLQFLDRKAGG